MNAIELFAGAGGASLGLHRAGVRALAMVEWDHHAASTLRAAVAAGLLCGDVIEGDVRAVDWTAYAGRVDLLWASPPCQAWSSAGKRLGAADERNGWPWTLDAIDAARPTWVLTENVPGLLHHKGDCTRRDVNACPACYFHGYIVPEFQRRFAFVDFRVLDAADHGVPQRRHRVFLVAGPSPIRWPFPTHADPVVASAPSLFGARFRPWVTVREALALGVPGDVRLRTGNKTLKHNRYEHEEYEVGVDQPSPTVRGFMPASLHGAIDPKHPPALPDAPAPGVRSGGNGHSAPPMWLRTECLGAVAWPDTDPAPSVTGKANTYVHPSDPGARGKGDRAGSRPDLLDRPSPAIMSREVKGTTVTPTTGTRRSSDVQCASDALYLGAGIRRLTPAECAILQSFPADWPWQGTKTAVYRQVGNAVPPTMAEALGVALLASARARGAA